jgi:DNA-binding NarL/FixJ family response regulator
MRAVDHALAELAEALSWRSAVLTERGVNALRLVASGLSDDDIARAPSGQHRIVHVHVRVLFAKLGVSTRTAAAHEPACSICSRSDDRPI